MENEPEYTKEKHYPIDVDWDNYLFRASKVGVLMPGPRAKEGKLQVTEMSELQKIYLEEVWGIYEDVSTKQMDKGTIQESEGIELMTEVTYPNKLIPKNTQRFSNDFITGHPDVIVPKKDIVHDIKCPWNAINFMKSDLKKTYEWQLRCYMWLLDLGYASLDYTLVNAPEEMILDEIRKKAYFKGYIEESSDEYIQMENDVYHNMTFDYIPRKMRLKSFKLTRDKSQEEQIQQRVKLWRETLKNMTL